MTRLAAAALLALLLAPGPVQAATRYLPRLGFRVIATPHFRIYYHQGLADAAWRLAAIAEQERGALTARLRLRAPGMTHVVLSDQDDTANGTASPLPYNTVTINLAWPGPTGQVGYTSDWLRMVFVHEYVHVLQLDQARGWTSALRYVFGRAPLLFPNLFLPHWQVEGLATYMESRETGEGRARAGDTRTLVRERIRRIGPEPLDRMNGGLASWPGALGPYLYGALFHEYLAAQGGEVALGELARRTAGRAPWFAAGAFTGVFGKPLRTLWRDFQSALAAGSDPLAPDGRARRVTSEGFLVAGPRLASPGEAILYTVRNPDEFPAIVMREETGHRRRIATRVGGDTLSVAGSLVVFDQMELDGNVAWRSDLYGVRLPDGAAVRITHDRRFVEPALAADASRLAVIEGGHGRRRLLVFDLEVAPDGTPRLAAQARLALDDGAIYGNPRWAPDGRSIVVERRVPGGATEIVSVDSTTARTAVLAAAPSGRMLTPVWMPDGSAVLFAWDRDGTAFQIHAASPDGSGGLRQVTGLAGGAMFPEVSADGRRLLVTSYTGEGYDVFESELDPSRWTALDPATARGGAVPVPAVAATRAEGVDRAYSPLPTVLPRSWSPLTDSAHGFHRVGLTAAGSDVLGRHAWSATALWRTTGVARDTEVPDRPRPDWYAAYVYDRWWPRFFVSASDETSIARTRTTGGLVGPDIAVRERDVAVGVSLPWQRARRAHALTIAFNGERVLHEFPGQARRTVRNALRTSWGYSSARRFGRSISAEQGVSVGGTCELVRAALGASGNAAAWTADARVFLPVLPRHGVVALRVGAATSSGDARVRRQFSLGGGDPSPSPTDFGSDALSLLRGLPEGHAAGPHLAIVNAEYRVPLWRVERGRGTVPLFLQTLHATLFLDSGEVWTHRFAPSRLKTGAGAELSADLVVAFGVPLTVTGGVAWARDRETGARFGAVGYVRVGRSF